MIEESAIEFEGEEVNEEEIVSEFKQFLENVTPDEFAETEGEETKEGLADKDVPPTHAARPLSVLSRAHIYGYGRLSRLPTNHQRNCRDERYPARITEDSAGSARPRAS